MSREQKNSMNLKISFLQLNLRSPGGIKSGIITQFSPARDENKLSKMAADKPKRHDSSSLSWRGIKPCSIAYGLAMINRSRSEPMINALACQLIVPGMGLSFNHQRVSCSPVEGHPAKEFRRNNNAEVGKSVQRSYGLIASESSTGAITTLACGFLVIRFASAL